MTAVPALEVNELLAAARQRAGLDDYGDMEFVEGLTVLVDSLNNEAHLHAQGMTDMRERLLRLLVNRLRIERDLNAHPEIRDLEVQPPVIICSPPRTGTTKLHRLLSASGDFLTLPFWQAHHPAPFPDAMPEAEDPRIEDTRRFERWMDQRSPEMKSVHPMIAEEPEEEMLLQEFSFRSIYSVAFAQVPSYMGWLAQQDMRRPYQYQKLMMQYLQWQFHQHDFRPWLLKAPSNLGFESIISDVFPGARYIMPHRNLQVALSSVGGVARTFRRLYSDELHRESFGAWAVAGLAQQLTAHMQWRDAIQQAPVLDVRFDDINSNEMATVERVYRFLGQPLTPKAREGVQRRIDMHDHHYRSKHTYTLAEYGLDAATIDQTFAEYNRRFQDYL